MARKKKAYQVVKSLPDGLGSIIVSGASLAPGEPLPPNTDKKIIKDCLERELIEESKDVPAAPKKGPAKVNEALRKTQRPVSKWALNPLDLVGKTLTQLNIMILEKDENAEPFDSLDAALEELSRDYEG